MLRKRHLDRDGRQRRVRSPGFTLVELLIVVAVLAIFAALSVARMEPAFQEQVRAAAEIIAADLHYARSLAVANNSRYRLTFDIAQHRYWLEHSGSNPLLDNLPPSPYSDPRDPPTRQTTILANLRAVGGGTELVALRKVSSSTETAATSIEFGPLGSLTQAEDCWIWIAAGNGDTRRYLPVSLDAVTGLADVGTMQTVPPAAPSSAASAQTFGGGTIPASE